MSNQSTISGSQSSYDRNNDVKAFDERRTGVKGLVDEGAAKLPSIFIRSVEDRSKDYHICHEKISLPVIDLGHDNERNCGEVIDEILKASEEWGFFQVVNHGIPLQVLEDMIEGIRMFHEQDTEVKKEFYTRDISKRIKLNSNYDLYKSKAANWRDTLNILKFSPVSSDELHPDELPPVCRDVTWSYIHHVNKLGERLLELLSIALGLEAHHLQKMGCTKAWTLIGHYYPPCPEPNLTLGSSKHSDPSFITILLQDHIGGLQVLHKNQWVSVEPIQGAFIVNIGDILQIISNNKLRSVYHRVVANEAGPRISIPFFVTGRSSLEKIYGPIKELISADNQPLYREFTLQEFFLYFHSRSLEQPGIEYFKI